MQAQATGPWFPALACWMVGETLVDVPRFAAVGADPQGCRIDAEIDRARLAGPSRLDDPDVLELEFTVLGKLDALLRLLPRLAEVVAVFQECPKKVAVVGGEQPMAVALVEGGVEDTRHG